MAGKIFISYRRGDDPGATGRLFDALKDTFDADRLFLDVDNIEPGLDFIEVIDDRVSKSEVLLSVIGQQWIEARDKEGQRRLENPQDSVRIEIESAINQKKRVIPVLIGETKIPEPEILPESLRVLARRNAVTIRHERFDDDMSNLTKALKRALGDDPPPPPAISEEPPPPPAAPEEPQPHEPIGMYAGPVAQSHDNWTPAWLTSLLETRVPLVACLAATVVLAGGLYFSFKPAPPEGGAVYMPPSLPGPVASVVPAPAVAVAPPPGPSARPPSPPKITPAAVTRPVPPSTPAPALAEKPNWCSEDHLKPDELTICATEDLWALDAQLSRVFGRFRTMLPTREL